MRQFARIIFGQIFRNIGKQENFKLLVSSQFLIISLIVKTEMISQEVQSVDAES